MSARAIIGLCQQHFPKFYNDCSGFVKTVANKSGVLLTGNANEIVGFICGPQWVSVADGRSARNYARNGWLVIGGVKKKSGHGHVVIVVDGPMDRRGKYPYAYWGRYHEVPMGNTTFNIGVLSRGHGTLNYAFGVPERDKVVYGATRVSELLMPAMSANEGYILHV